MGEQLSLQTVQQLSQGEPSWMLQKREEAFATFRELPMPEFRYGISIKVDAGIDFSSLILEKAASVIQAPQGFVFSLEEVQQQYPDALRCIGTLIPAQGKLGALHYAFTDYLFVIIPRETELQQPITIATDVPGTSFSHLIIIAEPLSKATVIESTRSDQPGYRSRMVEVFVGEGASVSYANIQHLDERMIHYTVKKAKVGKDATMSWLDCSLGAKLTLSNVLTDLEKPGAKANNWGMFFGDKEQQFDAHYSAVHKAPNTVSDMFTRGVLRDKAKAIYRGLIHIQRQAPKSIGIQKADTLLMNPGTEADAVPSLEIDNSDVKCNHGSSVGQVDPEKLFYLFSRGLSEEDALRQLVRGFFEPLALKIPDARLQDEVRRLIEVKLQ